MYTNIDISKIKMISDEVINATSSIIQSNKAIVGENAFKHEAGIHQDGVIKNRETYEILDLTRYGIKTDNIVIGIHSGSGAVVNKIKMMGYKIDEYNISCIVENIKNWFNSVENINNLKELPNGILIEIIDNNKKGKILIKKS